MIPGTRIGGDDEYEAGPGTFIRHKYLYSSLVGKVELSSAAQGEKPTLSVVRSAEPSLVPAVGSIVTGIFLKGSFSLKGIFHLTLLFSGQITRVNPRFASVKVGGVLFSLFLFGKL